MSKKILFFVILFNLLNLNHFVHSEIIPPKKPIQTKEEKQKKLLIDVLRPLPKPVAKTETEIVEKEVLVKKENKSGLILPKKKPLIAGSKKISDIKISKYYSKKDFSLAKKAISEMKKSNWSAALKTSKRAKDKSIHNFIQWRHLLKKGNQASYYD